MSFDDAPLGTVPVSLQQKMSIADALVEVASLLDDDGYEEVLRQAPGIQNIEGEMWFEEYNDSPEGFPDGTMVFSLAVDDGGPLRHLLVRVDSQGDVDYVHFG